MKAFVALFVISIVACTVPQYGSNTPAPPGSCDRVFSVAPDFTGDEVAALARAVGRWNAIASEQFCLSSGDGNERSEEHAIFKMHRGSAEYVRWADGRNVIGLHFYPDDRIAIVDDLNLFDFELVALHEFGHAKLIGHTPAPAIMHEAIGTAEDFTPIDLAACRGALACPSASDAGVAAPGGVSVCGR